MKIEKINDNQIRCTLNKNDLASREIKISELAYGTEKAKTLFRDMMQQAAYEVGFETDDLPLMIEAIPMSSESIVLIITKVDDPEELDTRFSKFAPPYEEFEDMEDMEDINAAPSFNSADDMLELFTETAEADAAQAGSLSTTESLPSGIPAGSLKKQDAPNNLTHCYSFKDFKTIEKLSHILGNIYYGRNSLYKDEKNHIYHLVLTKSSHTSQDFNKVLNITSEYGTKEIFSVEKERYFREHYQTLIDGSALQILGNVL